MFTKIEFFERTASAYDRGAYYISRDIPAHRDLKKIKRDFFGGEIRGVFSLERAASRARVMRGRNAGRPLRWSFVEVVVSTPLAGDLDEGEVWEIAIAMADGFRSVGGMFGAHWHRNGRTDIHILLVNFTIAGAAIATGATLRSTGRVFRNIEVVARQLADQVHDQLNEKRLSAGRPRMKTMAEIPAEQTLRWFEKAEALRAAVSSPVDVEGRDFDLSAEGAEEPSPDTLFAVTANAELSADENAEVEAPSDSFLRRDQVPPPAPKLEPPVRNEAGVAKPKTAVVPVLQPRWPWEQLTGFIFWAATAKDEDWKQKQEEKKQRWFADFHAMLLHDAVIAALVRDCAAGREDALEAARGLESWKEILLGRERDRGVGRDRD